MFAKVFYLYNGCGFTAWKDISRSKLEHDVVERVGGLYFRPCVFFCGLEQRSKRIYQGKTPKRHPSLAPISDAVYTLQVFTIQVTRKPNMPWLSYLLLGAHPAKEKQNV